MNEAAIKRIEIVTWFECNAECAFCTSRNGGDSFSTAQIIRNLEEHYARGVREVDFGGGEPTVREDILGIIGAARGIGYERIGIKTNGIRLCYPEFAQACIAAGADEFSVSMWGQDAAAHDSLAGRRRAYDMTEMAVKHLADFGADVCVDFLMTTRSAGKLAAALERIERAGARRVRLWLFSLFGSGGGMPELMPPMRDAGNEAQAAAKTHKRRFDSITTSHIMPCMLGRAAGMYFNARQLRLLVVTPGGDFFAEESPFESGVKTTGCEGCRYANKCAGPRPEYLKRFGAGEFRAVR